MVINIIFSKLNCPVAQSQLGGTKKNSIQAFVLKKQHSSIVLKKQHSSILKIILRQHKYILKFIENENDEGLYYLKYTTNLQKLLYFFFILICSSYQVTFSLLPNILNLSSKSNPCWFLYHPFLLHSGSI